MMELFNTADILIPAAGDMSKWAVIACDQFTSEPGYWAECERLVGEADSALRLMLPEAWLETERAEGAETRINAEMERCLRENVFRVLEDSFIYLERQQSDGRLRRGLVGAVDLEQYDFTPGSHAAIRSTEDTVAERLPPRVKVRKGAVLEMPHAMVLMNDAEDRVLGTLEARKGGLEKVYDFDLMQGSGHITGWRVCGDEAEAVSAAIRSLTGDADMAMAMGDGNHSLATARLCWLDIRESLSEAEREKHPARYALVELNNIHEAAIDFEPIHRLLLDTDTEAFLDEAESFFAGVSREGEAHHIRCITAEGEREVVVCGLTIGETIGAAERFALDYLKRHSGRIDYIHGDDTVAAMGREKGCCAMVLPAMDKTELFTSVERSGPFPRKSFSIGHARDKRFYLECRKIR
ncbi:MAG: DUF1015 domain-containing protein [Ruminococcaceae bacterium]|nr:DUF1015 domain-containing protein [Oscillospiraceae bacterium]